MTPGLRIAASAAALLAAASPAGAQLLPAPGTAADAAPRAGDLPAAPGAGGESRLVRLLRERAARGSGGGRRAQPEALELPECPRELLGALFAEAAGRADLVSALAIEREVLAMCRDRQKVVGEILRLEGELRSAARSAAPPAPPAAPPLRADTDVLAGAAGDGAPAPRPAAPAYAWFSILGSPGRLRAGVSDGAGAWFVREGDELPGGARIEEIRARPPGVRAGGGALPYRPRQSAP